MIKSAIATAVVLGTMVVVPVPALAGMLGAPAPKVAPLQDLVIEVQRRCHRDEEFHDHRGIRGRGAWHRHNRDCDIVIAGPGGGGGRDCHRDTEYHDHSGDGFRGPTWHQHSRRDCDVRVVGGRGYDNDPAVEACIGGTGLCIRVE